MLGQTSVSGGASASAAAPLAAAAPAASVAAANRRGPRKGTIRKEKGNTIRFEGVDWILVRQIYSQEPFARATHHALVTYYEGEPYPRFAPYAACKGVDRKPLNDKVMRLVCKNKRFKQRMEADLDEEFPWNATYNRRGWTPRIKLANWPGFQKKAKCEVEKREKLEYDDDPDVAELMRLHKKRYGNRFRPFQAPAKDDEADSDEEDEADSDEDASDSDEDDDAKAFAGIFSDEEEDDMAADSMKEAGKEKARVGF